jgi:hypothetical protein
MKASLRLAGLTSIFVGALAAPDRIEERAGCVADNCQRTVSITRLGQATQHARLLDCKSFLRVTVTPATSTALTTVTIMTTITPGASSSGDPVLDRLRYFHSHHLRQPSVYAHGFGSCARFRRLDLHLHLL